MPAAVVFTPPAARRAGAGAAAGTSSRTSSGMSAAFASASAANADRASKSSVWCRDIGFRIVSGAAGRAATDDRDATGTVRASARPSAPPPGMAITWPHLHRTRLPANSAFQANFRWHPAQTTAGAVWIVDIRISPKTDDVRTSPVLPVGSPDVESGTFPVPPRALGFDRSPNNPHSPG